MNKKGFILGVLVGGVAGACAALLTTPVSGENLRGQIKDSTNDWMKMANDIKGDAIELKESVSNLTKEGKEIFTELATDVKVAVQEWQQDISSNRENLQKEMQEIQDTIAKLEQQFKTKG